MSVPFCISDTMLPSSSEGFIYKENLYAMYARLSQTAMNCFVSGESRKGYIAAVFDKEEDVNTLVIIFALSLQEAKLCLENKSRWSNIIFGDGYISGNQSVLEMRCHINELSHNLPLINYELESVI